MWTSEAGVVNSPSNGEERDIPTALAVFYYDDGRVATEGEDVAKAFWQHNVATLADGETKIQH